MICKVDDRRRMATDVPLGPVLRLLGHGSARQPETGELRVHSLNSGHNLTSSRAALKTRSNLPGRTNLPGAPAAFLAAGYPRPVNVNEIWEFSNRLLAAKIRLKATPIMATILS